MIPRPGRAFFPTGHARYAQSANWLLVKCPPRDSAAALRLAAEHFAFCDECGGQGLRYVSAIAASLVGAPIWTFWWD